jgi:hypothetical protein
MFRAILITLIFLLPFFGKSQPRILKELPTLNTKFTTTFTKKQNLFFYKSSGFKFTLKPNINASTINKTIQHQEDSYNFVGYEFRAKYYLSKKVHLILRTKYNGANTIASFGVCFFIH